MKVLDLFSGIGGFSLGLERTGGFETVAFCEIDPFCRKVLAKHWPDVRQYDDVRTLTAERLRADGIVPDVICGGFPCQDISVAGRREGLDGTRSGLWGELCRLVDELRPQFAIVENVSGLLAGPSDQPGGWFGRVLGDLAEIGFDAEWHCIPAAAVGAPHIRDRLWIVAYPGEVRRNAWRPEQSLQGPWMDGQASVGNAHRPRLEGLWGLLECAGKQSAWADGEADEDGRLVKPGLPLLAHGVSARMERIASTGNAVVPQIPELIGRAILRAAA